MSNGISDSNGLYVLKNLRNVENMSDYNYFMGDTNTKYWLASPWPQVDDRYYLTFVQRVGDFGNNYSDKFCGVRPLICFNFTMGLELSEDGTYWIIK